MKWYVGVKGVKYTAFSSKDTPTEKEFGNLYGAVIGPFHTRRAAELMAKYGWNNPHLQTVSDAEKLAKDWGLKCVNANVANEPSISKEIKSGYATIVPKNKGY